MALVCGHKFHTRCWQNYFVSNSGWCTCPNCRAPSHVTEHWVNMRPEEFGIATPQATTPGTPAAEEAAQAEPGTGSLGSRDAAATASEEENDADMFPWWPCGEEHVYHANTRLPDGRTGLLIDTGAWANLSGDRWATQAAQVSNQAGFQATKTKMTKPMSVQGVGNGSQQCTWENHPGSHLVG